MSGFHRHACVQQACFAVQRRDRCVLTRSCFRPIHLAPARASSLLAALGVPDRRTLEISQGVNFGFESRDFPSHRTSDLHDRVEPIHTSAGGQ